MYENDNGLNGSLNHEFDELHELNELFIPQGITRIKRSSLDHEFDESHELVF